MNWCKIALNENACSNFKVRDVGYYYFVHSLEFIPDNNCEHIGAITGISGKEVVAAVVKDNMLGVQFHPEKATLGLNLIQRFFSST